MTAEPEGWVASDVDPGEQAHVATKLRRWFDFRRSLALNRRALLRFVCHSTGWQPLEWQAQAFLAGGVDMSVMSWNKLIIGGYGAGKSDLGAAMHYGSVVAHPGAWHLGANPTYDQTKNVMVRKYSRMVEAAERKGYRLTWRGVRTTELVDELVCGGRSFFRSYSKIGNLMGFEFATEWLDELDTVTRPREVWDGLSSRARQPGVPWRQIIVTTTPDQGEAGITGVWQRMRQEDGPRAWYWVRGTAYQNRFLQPSPDAYVRRFASMSKREFDVKVLGKITRPSTAVYPEYGERTIRDWRYDPSLPYDLALDGGDQYPHYLWIQRHPAGWAVIFDEFHPDDMPRERARLEVERRCSALRKPPENVSMDRALKDDRTWAFRTWGGANIRWCRTAREQSVADGIEVVRSLFDPVVGEPKLYVARHLTGQQEGRGIDRCNRRYRYKITPDGHASTDPHKDNIHDHGCDAERYWAVTVGVNGAGMPLNIAVAGTSRRPGGSRYTR